MSEDPTYPDRTASQRTAKSRKRTLKVNEVLDEEILEFAEENELLYRGEPNWSEAARELFRKALEQE